MTKKSDAAPTKSISNAANNQAVIWTIGSKPNANSNAGHSRARRRASKGILDIRGYGTKGAIGTLGYSLCSWPWGRERGGLLIVFLSFRLFSSSAPESSGEIRRRKGMDSG